MTMADPTLASPSWLCPSQTASVSVSSLINAERLEEARLLLNGLDHGSAMGQDEDGDT